MASNLQKRFYERLGGFREDTVRKADQERREAFLDRFKDTAETTELDYMDEQNAAQRAKERASVALSKGEISAREYADLELRFFKEEKAKALKTKVANRSFNAMLREQRTTRDSHAASRFFGLDE